MKGVFYIVAGSTDGQVDLEKIVAKIEPGGTLGRKKLTYDEANAQARDAALAYGRSQHVIRCLVERTVNPAKMRRP